MKAIHTGCGVTAMVVVGGAAWACLPNDAQSAAGLSSCLPCSTAADGQAAATQSTAAAPDGGATEGETGILINVAIRDLFFDPNPVTIPVDASIKWTNMGIRSHTVTHSAIPPLFDSGKLATGGTFQQTFTTITDFHYECVFHPGMEGDLSVRAPGDANNDRSVNIGDFSILAANFNLPGTYSQGDFNVDGSVAIGDFSILAAHFNQVFTATASRGSAVPEPNFTLLAATLLPRKRTRGAR